MMSLEKLINDDIKRAMLARESKKLEALRAIKSQLLILKTGKDASSGEIPESLELSTLQRLVKQRMESAELYKEQNREDLYADEIFQADIIKAYLPQQMTEEDLNAGIAEIIKETNSSSMKDMGKVMGMASKKYAGKADNKMVSKIVKTLLNS